MNGTRRMAAGTWMPSGAAWAVGAAGLLSATLAQAQSSACETLKTTLAARIESTGVRGYAMDVVPGRTPVPPGAKVIGNCDGGAFKVVYWRHASARKMPAADEAKVVAAPPPAPLPATPAPVAATATAAAPKVPAAITPDAKAQPVAAPLPTPAVAAAPAPAPAPAPPPAITPAVATSARGIAAVPAVDERVAVAAQPVPVEPPAGDTLPFSQRATSFAAGNWPWMSALLLLPLALWLWAWRAHRSAYDEAGLPRGPKL